MFKIKLNFIILSTKPEENKQFVCSNNIDEISLPSTLIDATWFENLDQSIIEYVQKNIVLASEYDLIPQLIKITLDNSDDTLLNIIYGFVVPFSNVLDGFNWISFNYLQQNKYTNLIFETIQKLK